MSRTIRAAGVSIKSETALTAACKTTRAELTKLSDHHRQVQLPGFSYRSNIDLKTGALSYDEDDLVRDYGSRDVKKNKETLDTFLQEYQVEEAVELAQQQGYTVVSRERVGEAVELMVTV